MERGVLCFRFELDCSDLVTCVVITPGDFNVDAPNPRTLSALSVARYKPGFIKGDDVQDDSFAEPAITTRPRAKDLGSDRIR